MKKVVSIKINREIKNIFKNDETWNTPTFFIRDQKLSDFLASRGMIIPKTKIYTIVRKISLKAEDKICERILKSHEDFEEAKYKVKYNYILPLLIKVHGIGWREATANDLDDDSLTKVRKAVKIHKFANRRRKRIRTVILQDGAFEDEDE